MLVIANSRNATTINFALYLRLLEITVKVNEFFF